MACLAFNILEQDTWADFSRRVAHGAAIPLHAGLGRH
jgi:hypothetical protein